MTKLHLENFIRKDNKVKQRNVKSVTIQCNVLPVYWKLRSAFLVLYFFKLSCLVCKLFQQF